jgi:DNA helicase HerA-like ATPase
MHDRSLHVGQTGLFADEELRLSVEDRRQHVYVIGKTGSGKSTLLRNLILQDIEAGRGVGLIDPHGDLALDILAHVPPRRSRETVYIAPADLAHPIGFNLLGAVPKDCRHLVASGVVEAFKNIFADSWGARLEYILYNSLAALLDFKCASLLGVLKLLTDDRYRRKVIARVEDDVVRRFWTEEFGAWSASFRTEALSPIQNKVGRILAAAPLRNILGQMTSTVDFHRIVDQGQVFVANLSKGQLGADKANLFGSLLLTQFQLAALRRADRPEEERRDFVLYIDEFQNFTTESFAPMLSEARKYRLSLVLAHQYLDQLSDVVRSAVFGNVGTLIVFRVGQSDAEAFAKELEHRFPPDDLTGLKRGEVRVRSLVNGVPTVPDRAWTLPPTGKRYGHDEHIIRRSRRNFGRPRQQVEEEISRFLR